MLEREIASATIDNKVSTRTEDFECVVQVYVANGRICNDH